MAHTIAETTTLKLTGPAERFQIGYQEGDAVIRIRTGSRDHAEAIAFELHTQLDAGRASLILERAKP